MIQGSLKGLPVTSFSYPSLFSLKATTTTTTTDNKIFPWASNLTSMYLSFLSIEWEHLVLGFVRIK